MLGEFYFYSPLPLLCRHVRRSSSRSETQTSCPCQAPKCGGSIPLQPLPAPGAWHRGRWRLSSTSELHPSPHRESWPQSCCEPQCSSYWESRCSSTHWRSQQLPQRRLWVHSAGVHRHRHHHRADEEEDHENRLRLQYHGSRYVTEACEEFYTKPAKCLQIFVYWACRWSSG